MVRIKTSSKIKESRKSKKYIKSYKKTIFIILFNLFSMLYCISIYLWQHTIVKILKHDTKSFLGLMLKEWIKFNKLENFNSILNYPIDDFTPSGNLSYMNQHGDILHKTPLRAVFNLRCYIEHLMDESENATQYLLGEENWMKQYNWKFIKYVIQHRHSMTPKQLKQ